MAKTIPFPGNKAAPPPDNSPAAKLPEPPESGAVMAALLEQRDRAIARRLTTQNAITKGALVPREEIKRILGRMAGCWRSTISVSSYSAAPTILAVLEEKNPTADAYLRSLLDDEAYRTGGSINAAMQKWLCSQEAREESAGGK
jgi:hypothetical protein